MGQKKGHGVISRFIDDESGQTTTEYILILAVVVMIALKFRNTFKQKLESAVNKLGDNIDKATDDIN